MKSGSIELDGEVMDLSSEVETRVVEQDIVIDQTDVGNYS